MEENKLKLNVLKKIIGYIPINYSNEAKFYRRGAIEKAIIKNNRLYLRIIVMDTQRNKPIIIDLDITQEQAIEFIFDKLNLKEFLGQKVKVFFNFSYEILGIEFLK